LMTLFTDESSRFASAKHALVGAVAVGSEGSTIERLPLIVGRVD